MDNDAQNPQTDSEIAERKSERDKPIDKPIKKHTYIPSVIHDIVENDRRMARWNREFYLIPDTD